MSIRNERTGGRRKNMKEHNSDPMEDLSNDIHDTKEEVKAAADEVTSASAPVPDHKRRELLRLTEDSEIEQSVMYLKKASMKVIGTINAEYEAGRLENTNVFLTDLVISRFYGILGVLDAIESSEALNNELQKDR